MEPGDRGTLCASLGLQGGVAIQNSERFYGQNCASSFWQ